MRFFPRCTKHLIMQLAHYNMTALPCFFDSFKHNLTELQYIDIYRYIQIQIFMQFWQYSSKDETHQTQTFFIYQFNFACMQENYFILVNVATKFCKIRFCNLFLCSIRLNVTYVYNTSYNFKDYIPYYSMISMLYHVST